MSAFFYYITIESILLHYVTAIKACCGRTIIYLKPYQTCISKFSSENEKAQIYHAYHKCLLLQLHIQTY